MVAVVRVVHRARDELVTLGARAVATSGGAARSSLRPRVQPFVRFSKCSISMLLVPAVATAQTKQNKKTPSQPKPAGSQDQCESQLRSARL